MKSTCPSSHWRTQSAWSLNQGIIYIFATHLQCCISFIFSEDNSMEDLDRYIPHPEFELSPSWGLYRTITNKEVRQFPEARSVHFLTFKPCGLPARCIKWKCVGEWVCLYGCGGCFCSRALLSFVCMVQKRSRHLQKLLEKPLDGSSKGQ